MYEAQSLQLHLPWKVGKLTKMVAIMIKPSEAQRRERSVGDRGSCGTDR